MNCFSHDSKSDIVTFYNINNLPKQMNKLLNKLKASLSSEFKQVEHYSNTKIGPELLDN